MVPLPDDSLDPSPARDYLLQENAVCVVTLFD